MFNRKTKVVETPAQMLKRVEAQIKADELRAEHAARIAAHNAKLRETNAATATVEAETIKTVRQERNEELRDRLINYGPLVIISGLAIIGQYGKFEEFMVEPFGPFLGGVISALCAIALELIALFLGLHALIALRRKDSAASLLIGATVIAGIVAWMNYDYFEGPVGVTFALFSFVAPFMWRVKIRSDHRNELHANGEIDTRGLKLARVQWLMHPVKSFKVYRLAAWTGERDVIEAVSQWETLQANKPVKVAKSEKVNETVTVELDHLHALVQNLQYTLESTTETDDTETVPALPPVPEKVPALPPGNGASAYPTHHPKWNDAVAKYDASIDSGAQMTQADLASEMGMSNRVLAGQVQRYVREMRERKARERSQSVDLATETR